MKWRVKRSSVRWPGASRHEPGRTESGRGRMLGKDAGGVAQRRCASRRGHRQAPHGAARMRPDSWRGALVVLSLLTWNLFHGRAVPPAGRELLREFTAALDSCEWDAALLQEVPPWWPEALA